jgi:hypothetical protein
MAEAFLNQFVEEYMQVPAKKELARIMQKCFYAGWNNGHEPRPRAQEELNNLLRQERLID